ncbi:hypothetical protein BB558_005776 [Smittium angustum]|uniref:U3 small nucleolar RNA-associated protein 6 N-terminal domain-containing protein n=1 Tax=Smittium angustum TaxID=133377 RepID=A0A2U1IZI7_SMIAN|nr:hypothetical protein BB558_005776 [Smittium angustum]
MAEIIQYKLEGMIPELEDLEQKEIFSKDEIKMIVKKRTNMEYSIKRRQPPLEDFMRYIEYEMNLDLLRKKRKHRLGIEPKPTVSDKAAGERIIGLFERAVERHRGNEELWVKYIEFVRKEEKYQQKIERFQDQEQLNQYSKVMKLFARAIQNFPLIDKFWLLAARFEFEINNNEGNARRLMQRGLRINKKSKRMWLEYCELELLFAEKIKLRRKILGIDKDTNLENNPDLVENQNNPYLQGQVAILIYKYAVTEISDSFEFRKSFVELFNKYKISAGVKLVLEEIKSTFAGKNPKAEIYSETALLSLFFEPETSKWLEMLVTVAENITELINSQESSDGITNEKRLETSNLEYRSKLAKFYQDWMIGVYSDLKIDAISAYLKALIIKNFENAEKEEILNPGMACDYMNFLYEKLGNSKDGISVSKRLIKKFDNYKKEKLEIGKLYAIYIDFLFLQYKKDNGNQELISDFDSAFEQAIIWHNRNSINCLNIYLIWLDMSQVLFSSKLICSDDIHKRFERAILSLNQHFNNSETTPVSELASTTNGNETGSNDNIDAQTKIQLRYINWVCPSFNNPKNESELEQIAARKAFSTILRNSKPTLLTLKHLLEYEHLVFDIVLSKSGQGLNQKLLSSNKQLKTSYNQIIHLYQLATSNYPEEKNMWEKYIQFLRRAGSFEAANNVLFTASKIHKIVGI